MDVRITDDFEVVGHEIDLANAEAVKAAGEELMRSQDGPFHVDLSELERATSVTVAVMLSWYRFATMQKKSILFMNLSEDLHNIIEFSGLTRVLLHRAPGM